MDDYSDRSCQAEETFRRIEPYLAQAGVTRLGRLTGLDRIGIPVWNAISPNARSIVINQGKGITDIDAKVSAAMEALERSFACSPAIARRSSSLGELANAGERSQTLTCLLSSGKQEPTEDETLEWVSGFDILNNEPVWVPFDAVVLDRTRLDSRYWQSSDGLASGNTETEAILHGLLERIERDAYVLWSVAPTGFRERLCVNPRSFSDPVIDSLATRIDDAGLQLKLFDITSDVGVPSYSAFLAAHDILQRPTPRFHDITVGHGTHPIPYRAVIRALTEAAQSRLTYISGARDDVFHETYKRPLAPETLALFNAAAQDAQPQAGPRFQSLQQLLAFVSNRLAARGIRSAISVPLAGGDVPFSVVKMLVPDLENPEGLRKYRFGQRALSRSLEFT
ncbi:MULTISPECIES: YcaO-like family protein [unclassified Sinorhizobium]|uniref:YcaO-like family protein n=1 Tax=unclassified Sinorhizobium TaxID=2613772 RepID=UPI003523E3A2